MTLRSRTVAGTHLLAPALVFVVGVLAYPLGLEVWYFVAGMTADAVKG